MVKRVAMLALPLATWATGAQALGKGTSMLAIELTSATATVAAASGGGYLATHEHPEVGVQGQYWYMMAEDYAVALSGGAGFSNETRDPGESAPAGATSFKDKTTSFNVRLGGDRVAKVADRAVMYGGPGVEFWSGKAKRENGTSTESESTVRVALSARLGATMLLSDGVGLTAHVGHRMGRASVEENGAKTTWWPSGFEGSMGVLFSFGGQ